MAVSFAFFFRPKIVISENRDQVIHMYNMVDFRVDGNFHSIIFIPMAGNIRLFLPIER